MNIYRELGNQFPEGSSDGGRKNAGFGINYRKNVLAGILEGYSGFIPNQQI